MNSCIPYLHFDGQASDAMNAYQQILGGKLQLLRYSDAPAGAVPMPAGTQPSDAKRVLHATLEFEKGTLMAADAPNSAMAERMSGVSVSLSYMETSEAQAVFEKLSVGGVVRMPFGKTFFSDGFGMVKDRFGTPWMVNSLKPI